MGKNLISKGEAVVRKMTVTENLNVEGDLTLSGDLSLDDITLADAITVETLTANTSVTTDTVNADTVDAETSVTTADLTADTVTVNTGLGTAALSVNDDTTVTKVRSIVEDATFENVADGTIGTSIISVTGAKVGDVVVGNVAGLDLGLLYMGAEVTDVDEVTLSVFNISGAEIVETTPSFNLLLISLS